MPPGFRPGFSARLLILVGLLFAEKLFLNGFVDFDRAQAADDFGAVLRVSQHWGFRFLVALAAALALFAHVRGGEGLRQAAASLRAAPVRAGWMLIHFALLPILALLSFLLYRHTPTNLSIAAVTLLWMATGIFAAAAVLLALAPWALWRNAARSLGFIWWYAVVAALTGTAAMQATQMLWAPTAALTFRMVSAVLVPLLPDLTVDPAARVLGTPRFAVEIADVCSGLEGVGLILAFCCAWLVYFRREYIFPRALLLIPAGVAAIFGLNVLRIAVLVLLGDLGFRDVAIYGFHSQAGWIAFIAVACGLVLLSRRSTWLNRSASPPHAAAMENPTAAYLMPLLAVLAAGALSRAASSDFEYLYPLRLLAAGWMLARYRRKLTALDWRCSWRGPVLGAAVFLMWMAAAHFMLPGAVMPGKLAAMAAVPRGIWIVCRVLGAVLMVPIVEELAYRGYLMRRLCSSDFESVSFKSVSWVGLAAASIVFGAAHGALWLPGAFAGLAYGLIVVRRGRLGEAVAAHATTNALIAATVLAGDQWQLW
jgi:exosortase E/protease (VPEID-CTERM system)